MATATRGLTPADLLTLPPLEDGRSYELVDGEVIIAGTGVGAAGARHEWAKRGVARSLFEYERRFANGLTFPVSLFSLGPETARIPDVAFVLNPKLTQLRDEDAPIPFAPDLAVEIISGADFAADAETKVRQYLRGGVSEVWQLYPIERIVRVRTRGGIRDLTEGETLTTPLLPDFSVEVGTFFTKR